MCLLNKKIVQYFILECYTMNDQLLNTLQSDFPDFIFERGDRFMFRPPNKIFIGPTEPHDSLLMMHELGHALCHHRDFGTDAIRLKMEREAWECAKKICSAYDIYYDEDVVERELDTYRDWLDKKSRCPSCGLTRFQTPDGAYHCPRCENF